MHYTIGQIVRTHPTKDGSFSVFKIVGFTPNLFTSSPSVDQLEVREINRKTGEEFLCETEFWHLDQVELYETENTFGKIAIGDKVRCMGLEGEHLLLGFYESRAQRELKAIVSYGPDEGGSIPWAVEFVRKV